MTKPPTNDDIVRLARQAGLDLPAEFMPELIEAYGHVRRMTERAAGRRMARRRRATRDRSRSRWADA